MPNKQYQSHSGAVPEERVPGDQTPKRDALKVAERRIQTDGTLLRDAGALVLGDSLECQCAEIWATQEADETTA